MEMTESHPTRQYFNFGDGDFGGYGGMGGNGLFTILLLFFLFSGGNGLGGFGARNALGADMAVQTAESVAENRAGLNYLGQTVAAQGSKLDNILMGMNTNTAAIQSSLCTGFNGLNTSILNSRYDITRAIEQCCCQTQQNIAALNANLDKATCAIITSNKDNTQAILSALSNHWSDEANRKICKLEQELNAKTIIEALKNA